MATRYAKYVKPRYESDPAFRASILQRNGEYVAGQHAHNEKKFRESRSDASRRCYHAHPEYREHKRIYSQERRRLQASSKYDLIAQK